MVDIRVISFDYIQPKFGSLERTLAEGRKTSNVDIQAMFQSISRCRNLAQQLIAKEEDPFYKVIVMSSTAVCRIVSQFTLGNCFVALFVFRTSYLI